MKKSVLFGLLLGLCVASSHAGDIVTQAFGGLNTFDNSSSIEEYQSQDLLNVLLQPRMSGVYKRDGYGLFQSLTISTSAVHGGYHFQQTGGSDVQLWGNDLNLGGSVNDSTFVNLATGTLNATWQCTDNLGFAYCVTSSGQDKMVKTDGTAGNTTYVTGIPSGTIVTSTPLQLVMAGVSGNVSTIYVSANNNFSNFTSGPLPTDPYAEIINAPGSRITHLGYYFGKIFWWKDQSFGYISGSSNQNTVSITIVSNQIGTLDNSSAFWNPSTYEVQNNFSAGSGPSSQGNQAFNEIPQYGGIFFRGQDGQIYQFDGYQLTRISRIISPTLASSNRRKSNSWTQTTQSDFQTGTISPTGNLSTAIVPGSVIVSSFQAVENSTNQWNSGTSSNVTVGNTSLTLTINNSGTVNEPSFEIGPNGNSINDSSWGCGSINCFTYANTFSNGSCTINPQSGSLMAKGTVGSSVSPLLTASILDATGSTTLFSKTVGADGACTWTLDSLNSPSLSGKRVKFSWILTDGAGTSYEILTSQSYIFGGNLQFYRASYSPSGSLVFLIDNIQNGSSTINSGSYTSQVYNTGFATATYQITNFSWTPNTSSPTFSLKTGPTSIGPWTTILTSSQTDAKGGQYAQYSTTISVTNTDNALTAITSMTFVAESTGIFYSSVFNAPNITSWGIFNVGYANNGGTHAFFVRSATNSFTVLSATPAWTSQTPAATVSVSTGTYFQFADTFTITGATQTPTLNDFTFNWIEGLASDKAYIAYFNDAIWFSVSNGTSTSTNNTVFYLDLINNAWLKHNIAADGFAIENNVLYFGDPSSGKIYKYGGIPTDNGNAIQSYWKSKDFIGTDPTTANEYIQSDFIFGSSSNTVTYTYTLDQSTVTTVSLSLYDSTRLIVDRSLFLAKSKIGRFYNFQVGDNSSNQAWKMLFHHAKYNPLSWKPNP